MKKYILYTLTSLLLLSGCKYETVLSEKQGLPLDPSVLGTWIESPITVRKNNPNNRLVIEQGLDGEYLIRVDEARFRAYPIYLGGIDCVQVEFLELEDQLPPSKHDTGKRFDVWLFQHQNDELIISTLNPELVSDELKETSKLQAAFLKHSKNPHLFSNPGQFRRLPK